MNPEDIEIINHALFFLMNRGDFKYSDDQIMRLYDKINDVNCQILVKEKRDYLFITWIVSVVLFFIGFISEIVYILFFYN